MGRGPRARGGGSPSQKQVRTREAPAGTKKLQSKTIHGVPGIPVDVWFQRHRRLSQAGGGLHPAPSRPVPHGPPVTGRASKHTEGPAETHGCHLECTLGRSPPLPGTRATSAHRCSGAEPPPFSALPQQGSRFNPGDPVPRICFTRGSRRPLTCSAQTHLLTRPDVCSLPGVSQIQLKTQQPSLYTFGFYQTRGHTGTNRCGESDSGPLTSCPRWTGGGSCGTAAGPPAWPRSARPGSPGSPQTGPSPWTGM